MAFSRHIRNKRGKMSTGIIKTERGGIGLWQYGEKGRHHLSDAALSRFLRFSPKLNPMQGRGGQSRGEGMLSRLWVAFSASSKPSLCIEWRWRRHRASHKPPVATPSALWTPALYSNTAFLFFLLLGCLVFPVLAKG